jgi:DNA damage-binding protein 1
MRSISLLAYKPMTGTLENVAYDYKPNWMTAAAMVDVDTYIGMETQHNLFVLRRNMDATDDAPAGSLDTVGQFHVGGYVNVIRKGSLAMRTKDASEQEHGSMLFCTREGAIGMLLPIGRELFEFLDAVQTRMRQVVHGVGGLDHESWRAFKTQNVTAPSSGAIDGDLIEQFVDLSAEQKAVVVAGPPALTLEQDGTHQPVTAAALTQRIEELIRLH